MTDLARPAGPPRAAKAEPTLARRLLSRKAAAMLARNTLVSCLAFGVSLGVLWLLVERFGIDAVIAAGAGFVAAQSLHYTFGRSWIFRGTERPIASGFVYFLINGGVGLVTTMALYALLLAWTPLDYLVARVLVSILAGLLTFVLNATLNFRRL